MDLELYNMESEYTAIMKSKHIACTLEAEQDISSGFNVITEADIEAAAKDAKDSVTKKITTFDQIKTHFAKDTKTYLDTYESKAKATNPIGLVIQNYRQVELDKFISISKQVFVMLDKKENEGMKLQELATLKAWIHDNIYNDAIYKEIFKILFNGDKVNSDLYITEIKEFKVTKSDIYEAINTLKSDDYSKLISEYRSQIQYFDAQLNTNVDIGSMSGKLDSNIEEYQTTIKLNMISLRRLAMNQVLTTYSKLVQIKYHEAKKVVRKAALYNPRSFKESIENLELDVDE